MTVARRLEDTCADPEKGHLNELYVDYTELGVLLITVMAVTFLLPMVAILLVKMTLLRRA